jgi:hypothetical protein
MHFSIDPPELITLAPGADPQRTLVIINGYRTDRAAQAHDFARQLRQAQTLGWEGAVAAFWWDSSNKQALLYRSLTPAHWHLVKRRAKQTGKSHFASTLAPLRGQQLTIVAHSLGARVAFYGLMESARHEVTVENLILLGGAVRRSKSEWPEVIARVDSGVYNLYNRDDKVLHTYFKVAEFRSHSPCGQKPLEVGGAKVRNIDVTELIAQQGLSGHTGYWEALPQVFHLEAASSLLRR